MKFNCAIENMDEMIVEKSGNEVRFQLIFEEPVFYLKEKDLSILIQYLQSLEGNK